MGFKAFVIRGALIGLAIVLAIITVIWVAASILGGLGVFLAIVLMVGGGIGGTVACFIKLEGT